MGFIPHEQEEKWFSYLADNVLYQHRSWTGICIDKIYFEPCQDGMLATHAEVNRNHEEYDETDDEADIQRIREMLAYQGTAQKVLGALLHEKTIWPVLKRRLANKSLLIQDKKLGAIKVPDFWI